MGLRKICVSLDVQVMLLGWIGPVYSIFYTIQ